MDVGGKCSAQEANRLVRVVEEPDLQRDEPIRPKVDHLQVARQMASVANHCQPTWPHRGSSCDPHGTGLPACAHASSSSRHEDGCHTCRPAMYATMHWHTASLCIRIAQLCIVVRVPAPAALHYDAHHERGVKTLLEGVWAAKLAGNDDVKSRLIPEVVAIRSRLVGPGARLNLELLRTKHSTMASRIRIESPKVDRCAQIDIIITAPCGTTPHKSRT